MGKDLEQQMRDKMEQGKLDDIMPDFDKDMAWEDLSARLPEPKKKRPVIVWWTHAAALIAGILLGGVALKMLLQPQVITTEPQIVTVEKYQEPEVVVKTDTVFITKEIRTTPVESVVNPERKENVVIAKQQDDEVKEVAPPKEEVQQQQKDVIVQTKPKKVKPVHLLDMENEDRSTALYHNDPAAKQRSGFVFQINPDKLPDANTKQSPTLIGITKKHN